MSEVQPTVFIVDDDQVAIRLAEAMIKPLGYAVESFTSAEGFLQAYQTDRAGCVVLDMKMQGLSGLDLQQMLRERGIHIPIIILSAGADLPVVVQSVKLAAVDFLTKPVEAEVLQARVNEAIAMDRRLRAEAVPTKISLDRLQRLTPREKEVMQLVVAGLANKQIAAKLGLSEKTVEVHRGRVMQKMEAGSLAELVRMSIRAGMSEPIAAGTN